MNTYKIGVIDIVYGDSCGRDSRVSGDDGVIEYTIHSISTKLKGEKNGK